ncbi:MAG: peptide ABC transporter substrate-binding protein, partial [Oscillochloris sp.]|nr:peptide ABC transporter substrate-binding protein [Oscillochloris sp.]
IEKGKALLEEAGWTMAEGDVVRANANGDSLSLGFTTTNAQFRQTWSAVFIQQMTDCGIQIVPTYAPGSWWFGSSTGLRRRDFELGGYAWVGEPDPKGQTLYACNQIPLASNNWEGQNYMGWCNKTASDAILAANNTLDREERIKQYAIFQQEFTKDMVSLPLFNRTEAAAASNRVNGFKPNPTEYYTSNINEWTVTDGDTVVLGFTQEPTSLWVTIESSASQRIPAFMISTVPYTKKDYDYQAVDLKQLPTIDNGGATNIDIEVKEGDKVWSTAGEPVDLAPGVEVVNTAGETVTYKSGTVTMKQLAVTFEYNEGIKWEDGKPLSQADFELGRKIDCDPDSGAVDFTICDSIAKVDFLSDTKHTITYLPGVQWPEYFIYTINAYPAHQVLSDGRKLADVPAKEWQTLAEITEDPLSTGPYVLDSWQKGQSMTFTANPNYYKGEPTIKKVVIKFIADTNQAVAQLLTGDLDVLGPETLGGGAEVQSVLDAAKEGQVQATTIASPTWEHIDFNLFVK